MSKVRDELRAAFDKEQSALGEVGDARQRLIRGALAAADAPASRNLQWAAAIAAVLIAAIIVTTFALVRATSQHQVPVGTPSPRANASPTPLTRELNVSPSTPLILYGDAAKADQVDGVTWDGKDNGRIASPVAGMTNPGATLFATANEIRDRSGKLIATGTFGAKYFTGTWADDGQHICLMVPVNVAGANGVPATLQLITVGQAPRSVAQVGKVYEQVKTYVAACSVHFDRALVVQSGGQGIGTAQDWMVQLSTGRILWTQDFTGHASIVTVIASSDCKYIAVNYGGQGPSGSTIYGTDGSPITPEAGQPGQLAVQIFGFSADDLLAVETPATGNQFGNVTVIRWRDGSVVWQGPTESGFDFSRLMAGPHGSLAIGISDPAQLAKQAVNLYVISAEGHVLFQGNDVYW